MLCSYPQIGKSNQLSARIFCLLLLLQRFLIAQEALIHILTGGGFMNKKSLQDQIWTTRVSRINAERRLIKKEKIIQGINIYYSCVTIIFSILSVLNGDAKLSLITTFMSICLLVTILYLNAERYLEHAKDYRSNYTALHKLEMRLDSDTIKPETLEEIRLEYCNLLDSAWNHIPYDYYCTVYQSTGDYRTNRWKKNIIAGFWWGKIWRATIIALLLFLPIVVYFLCGVI